MAIFEYIEDKLPGWTKLTPYRQWRDLFLTLALVSDAEIDGLYDGRLASFPNQVALPDLGGYESINALPLIGRDRRIPQGPNEPTVTYAARLRAWRQTWRSAGTAQSLLKQLQAVLSPNPPRVRIVDTFGTWHTLEPDGTYKLQNRTGSGFIVSPTGEVDPDPSITHPWDWDSLTRPVTNNNLNPYRIWAIIYLPTNPPLTGTEGTWGDGLSRYIPLSQINGSSPNVVGTTGTANHTDLLRGVMSAWRAAGVKLSHFILAFDSSSFDPLTPGPYPAAGMPDGYWGHHGRVQVVGGRPTWVRSRLSTARYMRGLNDADY